MFSALKRVVKAGFAINVFGEAPGIDEKQTIHQVTVTCDSTVGLLPIFFTPYEGGVSEPAQLNDEDYELDLSTGIRTFTLKHKSVFSVECTPTGMDGSTWGFVVQSGVPS